MRKTFACAARGGRNEKERHRRVGVDRGSLLHGCCGIWRREWVDGWMEAEAEMQGEKARLQHQKKREGKDT